jgi:hypothetical protein
MILFLNNREDLHDHDNVARLVGQITERLHMQLNIPLRSGIGNQCNELDDIYTSFTRAKIALHQIKTPYGVSCYSQLMRQDMEQQYPVMKEQDLYRKMSFFKHKRGQQHGRIQRCQLLFQSFQEN